MKHCSKCKKNKPFEDFYTDKRSKSGYRSDCIDCCGELSAEAYLQKMILKGHSRVNYLKRKREKKNEPITWSFRFPARESVNFKSLKGTVEAFTKEQAKELAMELVKFNLDEANKGLAKLGIPIQVELDLSRVIVSPKFDE